MKYEKAIEIIQKERDHCATHNQDTGKDEEYHKEMQDLVDAFGLALHVLETGEIYMTAEDYNLFLEGYKQGKKDFARPKGEWIAREDMDYLDENKVVHKHFMCNKCGFIHDFIDGHTTQYNFCPNCGADMRKGGAE